jgi:hypothetical protein
MMLYAELPARRARQIVADVGVALWILVWVWVGTRVFDLVERLGAPGRTVSGAGRDLVEQLQAAQTEVSDLPVVGQALAELVEDLSGAGRGLQRAGASQQEVVGSLAWWLGVVLALIPIVFLLVRYLPRRWRWMREASAAQRLRSGPGDLRLFAWRALANRELHELSAVSDDPVGDLEAGDYARLARLEITALGLKAEL